MALWKVEETVVLWLAMTYVITFTEGRQPNIVYLLADDMGWGDVGYSTVPEIPTPNLRQLKEEGTELTQFYTQSKCTASRAALMTGRFTYKMGVSTWDVFRDSKNNFLSLENKLLPAFLKDQGYATHLVGKWHLGFCNEAHTPIKRGFDTSFGSFSVIPDHFYHGDEIQGYDWHLNNEPYFQANGTYSTHLITTRTQQLLREHFAQPEQESPIFLYVAYNAPHTPVQVPKNYYKKTDCSKLQAKTPGPYYATRTKYCGMVVALDESVGLIVQTLRELGQLENTLVLFHSDNGASIESGASSWELRGSKQNLYEGGHRSRTILRVGESLRVNGVTPSIYNGLVHEVDMLPTFFQAAGGDPASLPGVLDGRSAWTSILYGEPSQRQWMVYNIDSSIGHRAIRLLNATHNFKLVFDADDTTPGWTSPDPRPLAEQEADPIKRKRSYHSPSDHYRLFDMTLNPTELEPMRLNGTVLVRDAALDHPEVKAFLIQKMEEIASEELPSPHYQRFPDGDHPGNPSYWTKVYGYPVLHPGGCHPNGTIVTTW